MKFIDYLLLILSCMIVSNFLFAEARPEFITLKAGDDLKSVAKRYLNNEEAWVELKILNQIVDVNKLKPGQKLLLPGQERDLADQTLQLVPPVLKDLDGAKDRGLLTPELERNLTKAKESYWKAQTLLRQTQYRESIKEADKAWKQLMHIRQYVRKHYRTRMSVQVEESGEARFQVHQGATKIITSKTTQVLKTGEGIEVTEQGETRLRKLISPPEPLFPADGTSLYQTKVVFRWKPSDEASKYFLLLSKDDEFKQVVARLDAQGTEAVYYGPLQDGTYYWFVSGVDREGFEGQPSGPRRFQVKVDRDAPDIKPDAIQWE